MLASGQRLLIAVPVILLGQCFLVLVDCFQWRFSPFLLSSHLLFRFFFWLGFLLKTLGSLLLFMPNFETASFWIAESRPYLSCRSRLNTDVRCPVALYPPCKHQTVVIFQSILLLDQTWPDRSNHQHFASAEAGFRFTASRFICFSQPKRDSDLLWCRPSFPPEFFWPATTRHSLYSISI